jgi:PAS domain S-box-containing protein
MFSAGRISLGATSADLLHHDELLAVSFNSWFVDSKNWIRRHDRLRAVGMGVLSVATAMLIKLAAKDWSTDAPSYVLFGSAIAVATWLGGWPAGLVATLTTGFFVQFLAHPAAAGPFVGGSTFLLFAAEALFLVVVVARIQRRRAQAASRLEDADAEIVRLQRREQDLQVIEQAFEAVAANVRENACLLLDVQGRVTRWNQGAERLYGYPESSVLGVTWPAFGAAEDAADAELLKLTGASMTAAPAVGIGWMRTADGQRFCGEVAATPLRDKTGVVQGFTVIVRDLTTEQAAEEFRRQALAAQEALRGEADALTDQLEVIQVVLDPELSDLPLPAMLKELTGRVLTTLGVDGVAFVDTRDEANGVVFTPSRGLLALPKRGSARSVPRRLRIIQNDAPRAREGSVVTWPEAVGLMVTVPVARQKQPLGALEVVTRRPRRWTERDAIVLLLAADRAAAALAAATTQESSEPAAAVNQDRLSLPQ